MNYNNDTDKSVLAVLSYICLMLSVILVFTITQWPGQGDYAHADTKKILKNKYEGKHEAVEAGEKLFKQYCRACHGNGTGGIGPNLLDATWKYGGDDKDVFDSISKGRPEGMPAWNAAISEDDIWKIIAFLRNKHE